MIVVLIMKLTRQKKFMWIEKCQKVFELIKQKYIKALILISSKWDVEFHVHANASLLALGALLAQNITRKNDQLVMYASKLFNSA
jgi:hypothetical protein